MDNAKRVVVGGSRPGEFQEIAVDVYAPTEIKAERTGRTTVRIQPLSNAELVYGRDDDAAHDDRDFYNQLQWERGL